MHPSKSACILFLSLLLGGLSVAQDKQLIPLPTSKQLLLPVPGAPQRLNNFPQSIAISPDGRYAAVLNNGRGTSASGFQQSIAILDLTTNQLTDFPDARLNAKSHQTYFLGLAFGSRGYELYASFGSITDAMGAKDGDTGNGVAVYGFHDGRLTAARFLKIPLQELAKGRLATQVNESLPSGRAYPFPSGLAVVPAHTPANAGDVDQILVANNYADNALILDSKTGAVLHCFDLSVKGDVPRLFPFGAIVVPNSSIAYVSLWNSARVVELDLAKRTIRRVIKLEHEGRRATSSAHASAMTLSFDAKYLFVALANRDRVAAVRVRDGKVVKKFSTSIAGSAAGAVPTAVAASADGKYLFVADAALNAVAVFRLDAEMRGVTSPIGFVPTEWYPTALASQGGDLLVVSGKGTGAGPNNGVAQKDESRKPFPYILTLQPGSLARVKISDIERDLPALTLEVRKSNLVDAKVAQIQFHPEVMRASGGGRGPIRHVIYVIKENRTYDQLLGDLGVGDGDASLAIFGRAVTPNHRKLALQFGVLDNFYDSGEVSGVGHVWSTAATTSDYHERVLAPTYKGEHSYDYEGKVANASPLQQRIPDVAEPATGHLWANAARHHRTYRHYGEYVETKWCGKDAVDISPATSNSIATCARKAIQRGELLPANVGGAASPWPWPVPMIAGNVATKKELVGHFDPLFPDFKDEYPDQLRADEFLREFAGFVEARKRGKRKQELPELVVLRLPNDHTLGTRAKLPTPSAQVADNDLALGRVVEAVSHSAYWDDTAILVLEDDAQDGPDHVDAHRSLALVISKYSPGSAEKPFVEHDFYTTVNMIRTLEDLLVLPPMNQNDALASPMWRMFSGRGEQASFVADYSNRDNGLLYQMNPENNRDAKASAALDFSDADAADAQTLNAIIWRSVKGDEPMPEVKRVLGTR